MSWVLGLTKVVEGNFMHKKWMVFLLLLLLLSSCTRSLSGPPSQATVTPTLWLGSPVPPVTQPLPTGSSNEYAVIQVFAEEVLNIRSGPGMGNSTIGALQSTQSGLLRTGRTSLDGEDTWFEIKNPDGGTGWVNADYLTEFVSPSSFCADERVKSLLQGLENAVTALDGKLMMTLVSPAHGLDVGYIRDGTVVNYSVEEASWIFDSTYIVEWGIGAGNGELLSGTFPEVVLPPLQNVFKKMTLSCNEIGLGGATYEVEWPIEYTNINFYSLHNPGNDPTYEGLDWQTWLVGVEYVDGKPYLFSLLHYQWEP